MEPRVVREQEQSSAASFLTSLALIGMSLILASCASTTEPARVIRIVPASPTVAIQQTVYGRELQVDVTLTNTSSNPIYYDRCAVSLQRRADGPIALTGDKTTADGVWFTVWGQICAAIALSPPPTLQPGESVTIPIAALVGYGGAPPQWDGTPGVYRARLVLATKFLGTTRQLSEEESSSTPFTVVAN